MAEFDADLLTTEEIETMRTQNQQLRDQVNQLQNQRQYNVQPRANLNLPQPPFFLGNPLELQTFKIKVTKYLRGNFNTFFDDQSQIMYAGGLLQGPAQQWYESLIDPISMELPINYTLDIFLDEMSAFFGGALTQASREHSLDDLRQTSTVSVLAIAFQNIINTYIPRWTDSASIYIFSRKLKEAIRFEVTARGNVPTTLQAYIAAAIAVEHNQAAAVKSRHHPQQQQQQQQQQPRLPGPSSGAGPMDLDGSRTGRGPLSSEERRRRADNHLCAYCGQADHSIATCPTAARVRQARGTFPGFPSPPPGYFHPPPGFHPPPVQGSYPGPWAVIPSPHTQFVQPLPPLPKNESPSQ